MAQFDAYANPNASQRAAFPYFVVIQSDQLSHYSTRLVMPLARLPRPPQPAPRRLAQSVSIADETLYPAPHLCAALPSRLLGNPKASLRSQADVLRDALDAIISGV